VLRRRPRWLGHGLATLDGSLAAVSSRVLRTANADRDGDVRVVTLPASGIVVLISTRHDERAPRDDRQSIIPDVPVEVTWDDYAAPRDPVMEAALTP
jgi:hypothetical protein